MELPYDVITSVPAPGLMTTQPGVAIPYAIILAIFSIVGTIGNILVIGTIMTGRNRSITGNFFIINLTICDLVVTSIVNPVAIIGVVKGERLFDGGYWACNMLASVCVIVCVCSLLNIGAISINRYIFIVHNKHYERIYSKTNSILLCLLNWLMAYLIDMPTIFGWGADHVFDMKSKKCLWDRPKNWHYIIFVILTGMSIPLMTTTLFYLLIFLHITSVKKRVVSSGTNSNKLALTSSIRQAKMMFVIFVCFTTCWLPYLTILFIDRYDTFPMAVHLYFSLIAHLHASINFFIYGSCNRRIRSEYERFFYKSMSYCQTYNTARSRQIDHVSGEPNRIVGMIDSACSEEKANNETSL